jgi:phosphoglycolate phosphatase
VKPSLIFDLDGTLVDSLPGIAASLNRCLTAHGLPGHSNDAVRSFIGDGLFNLIRRAVHAGAEPALMDSLLRFYKADYEATWPEGSKAYPGILGLLEELQKSGFQLAVLSNKVHDFTVSMTQLVFPSIHFAKVLGQRDGIPHKPDPTMAFLVSSALGASPENCIIIGDSTMDILMAANAGMASIAVSWGYHDRDRLIAAGATRMIDHPSMLPALLV